MVIQTQRSHHNIQINFLSTLLVMQKEPWKTKMSHIPYFQTVFNLNGMSVPMKIFLLTVLCEIFC